MDRERLKFWFCALAALLAGVLLRLWFVVHEPRIAGDSLIYGAIAKNWLQHGVYGFVEDRLPSGLIAISPTLIRLPGYPLFLVACFRLFGMEHYNAVLYMQIAADLLTCGLASALAGRLFGCRARLPVLWIAALCPFTASYTAAPLTESLVLTTIALAFYGFARWQEAGLGYNRWLWIIAGALACSVLLRPDQCLLAAAVLPAMLWRSLATCESRRRPLRAAWPVLIAALCVVLPLLPWTARNWRTFHVFQPLAPRYANDPGEMAPLGFNRWYRTWAIDFASTDEVYWNLNGDPIEIADLPPRAFNAASQSASVELRNRTAALLDAYNSTTTLTPALDDRFAALAAQRRQAHPLLNALGLPVARVLDMALRPRIEMTPIPDEWWRPPTPRVQTAFAASYAALNLAYLAAALIGFYAWRRRAWLAPNLSVPDLSEPLEQRAFGELAFAMVASLLLRVVLLLTLDNSEPRYTLEFFPVLFVWIGALFAETQLPVTPQNER